MLRDPASFRYEVDLTGRINGKSFYWTLPGDIAAATDLFAAFREALWFPPEFGLDWDALLDGLCDFSWAPDRKIVLIHHALPRLPEAELRQYLTILRDAVRWWRFDDPHELEVVFPEAARSRIAELIGP